MWATDVAAYPLAANSLSAVAKSRSLPDDMVREYSLTNLWANSPLASAGTIGSPGLFRSDGGGVTMAMLTRNDKILCGTYGVVAVVALIATWWNNIGFFTTESTSLIDFFRSGYAN